MLRGVFPLIVMTNWNDSTKLARDRIASIMPPGIQPNGIFGWGAN